MCPVVALEWWCAVSERGAKREATEGSGMEWMMCWKDGRSRWAKTEQQSGAAIQRRQSKMTDRCHGGGVAQFVFLCYVFHLLIAGYRYHHRLSWQFWLFANNSYKKTAILEFRHKQLDDKVCCIVVCCIVELICMLTADRVFIIYFYLALQCVICISHYINTLSSV